jgi:hypothetical protein
VRRIAIIVALALTASFAALGGGSKAFACDAGNGYHCFAWALWYNTGYNYEGTEGTLNAHCLYSSITSGSYFASEEMWTGTDDSGGLNYWIEEGAIHDSTGKRWFWANYAPGFSQIYVHYSGPAFYLDTNYPMAIYWIGGKYWDVTVNGNIYGQPYGNSLYTNAMAAGTEYTSGDDRLVGKLTSLGFLRTDGTWSDSWWGAQADETGPHWYATATMPSQEEVDWSTPC